MLGAHLSPLSNFSPKFIVFVALAVAGSSGHPLRQAFAHHVGLTFTQHVIVGMTNKSQWPWSYYDIQRWRGV